MRIPSGKIDGRRTAGARTSSEKCLGFSGKREGRRKAGARFDLAEIASNFREDGSRERMWEPACIITRHFHVSRAEFAYHAHVRAAASHVRLCNIARTAVCVRRVSTRPRWPRVRARPMCPGHEARDTAVSESYAVSRTHMQHRHDLRL